MSALAWPAADGGVVSCTEKLRVLGENLDEFDVVLRDLWEDAILMGVDEVALRRLLAERVGRLQSPRRP